MHMATKKRESTQMGIAWYDSEQFARLLELADDKDELESTLDEWLENATSAVEILEEHGFRVQKIHVDMNELQRYCVENSSPNTSETRAGFVAEVLRKRESDKAHE